jgi:serine/threonine protein kinase
MEFTPHISSSRESIGSALPVDPPPINDGALVRANVFNSAGGVEERTILVSSSGAYYELGRTLRNAIYGAVIAGSTLQLSSSPSGTGFVHTGERVAIKVVSKRRWLSVRGQTQEDPERELAIMYFYQTHVPTGPPHFEVVRSVEPVVHPNLVHLLECCHDEENIYNIMTFIDGQELHDFVMERRPLGEVDVRKIFRSVLNSVQHLHALGLCHRDLSLENIIITPSFECVVIDFGMALRVPLLRGTGEHMDLVSLGQCGKPPFMAPEVQNNERTFNGALSDMWALGIILFMLLTGFPPMKFASPLDPRHKRIANGRLGLMLQQWNIHLSPNAVELLTKMLRPVPLDRLTISQILEHPWMTVSES